MKQKHIFALCAFVMVAAFFGLAAVAESSLPLWEGIGCIAGILLIAAPVVRLANRAVEEDSKA